MKKKNRVYFKIFIILLVITILSFLFTYLKAKHEYDSLNISLKVSFVVIELNSEIDEFYYIDKYKGTLKITDNVKYDVEGEHYIVYEVFDSELRSKSANLKVIIKKGS